MKFTEIAALSGKGGLFRVINPTRSGVILESLDGTKKRMIAGVSTKVSVFSEISIYVMDETESVPLQEVFKAIHKTYAGEVGLDKKSDPEELKSFFKSILPNYDAERVYVSDIKKVITWYQILLSLKLEHLIKDDIRDMPVKRKVKSKKVKSKIDNGSEKIKNQDKKQEKS